MLIKCLSILSNVSLKTIFNEKIRMVLFKKDIEKYSKNIFIID